MAAPNPKELQGYTAALENLSTAEIRNRVKRTKFHLAKLKELGIVTIEVIGDHPILGIRTPTKIQIKPQPIQNISKEGMNMPEENLVSRNTLQQYILEYDDTVVKRLVAFGYAKYTVRAGSAREWLVLTEKGQEIGVQIGKTFKLYFDKSIRALHLRLGQKGG